MYTLNEKEFEIKYNLYSQELMNITFGYTRNKYDSLDIIQDVFLKLFTCNKKFNSLQDEKRWLIRVTINKCKDYLRKSNKIILLDDETLNYHLNKNIDKDDDNVRLYKVSEVVSKLSEKYKTVTILFYYDSLSINEISKVLKISESAIKKRLERARNIIKNEMEDYYD